MEKNSGYIQYTLEIKRSNTYKIDNYIFFVLYKDVCSLALYINLVLLKLEPTIMLHFSHSKSTTV